MIRYSLICDRSHEFESWFPSGDACDEQIASGLLTCPVCHSGKLAKQIMAPSVARSGENSYSTPEPSASDTGNVALVDEKAKEVRAMLQSLREHLEANSENVGAQFPEEARKIHYGETERRSIHGQTSLEEAKALLEEGVDVHPLPFLPDDRN